MSTLAQPVSTLVAAALVALVIQAPARMLEIDAVAVDRSGTPVVDLKPSELEVWINRFRIPIESLTIVTPQPGERAGRLIALLLDDVTVDPRTVPRAKQVARRFVTRMLPDDRMAVALLTGGLVELTSDQPKLLARLDSYNQTAGFIPAEQIGAQVLTTVAALSRQMSEAGERRKAIVAIGSGWLFDTPIPPAMIAREVRREWLDAVRAMGAANVNFYVIDPGGVGVSRAGSGTDGFARDAGGHAFINTNDLTGAADRIVGELDTYYVIRVSDPPLGRKDAVRELDVRSKRRGVTVRARRIIPG